MFAGDGNKTVVPKGFWDADTKGGSQFSAKTLVSRSLLSHCCQLIGSSKLAKGSLERDSADH